MLWSMDPDRPVQTWHLVCAILGSSAAESLGPTKARHKCAWAMEQSQLRGYVRKLPTKAPTSAPSTRYPRKVYKEALWVITDKGLETRDSMPSDFPAGTPSSGGQGS